MAGNLYVGKSGDDVKKLQQSLADAGYDIGSKGVNGVYSADTQAAVRRYQRANGLEVDGIAGDETFNSLYKVPQASAPSANIGGTNSGSGSQAGAAAQGTGVDAPVEESKYQAPTYDPSSDAAYQQALAALQSTQNNAPTYANSYDEQLQSLYDQIVNRGPFKYDLNSDMLYQQYAQQYRDAGQLAMRDTMGQAAALTGGYGSSYGQAVGQQQYDAYLQQLNDVIPELYGQAYDQYRNEGNDMLQQYALLGDRANDEYGKYQDEYNRWLTERNYAQAAADDAYNRGYSAWKDNMDFNMDRAKMLASAGDYSGYADIYGQDAADEMQQTWIMSNPDMAYQKGLIDPEQYYALTGMYPIGYVDPNAKPQYTGGPYTPPDNGMSDDDLLGELDRMINEQIGDKTQWRNSDDVKSAKSDGKRDFIKKYGESAFDRLDSKYDLTQYINQ